MAGQAQVVARVAPVIVPKSVDAWTQTPEWRVDYMNRSIGSRCLVYFSDEASAVAFAAEHTLWNQPCVVQSKTMGVTHEVKSCAPSDPSYVFWTKQFGNLESAQAEFDRGAKHAAESGGSYRLVQVGVTKPLASFTSFARST